MAEMILFSKGSLVLKYRVLKKYNKIGKFNCTLETG